VLALLAMLCVNVDIAECVKYVDPAVPLSIDADTTPDLQHLFFCPVCIRSRRPSLELLSTLTCSLQSLMVALPEATAAKDLHHRAVCWHDKVQQILRSDEVRAVQNELAGINLMSQHARSHAAYILQRGIVVFWLSYEINL